MTWEKVRLKDLGTWYGGGTPSKSNPSFWDNGNVPWLSPKDMGPEVLQGTKMSVTEEAVSGSSAKLVPAGSVTVVTRSGILERTIPVALVPFATTMNQDMKAVVPREGIDPRWVAWGLRAFEPDLLRGTRKAGTTVASIEMPRWYNFRIPVPVLDEQRRIVSILEEYLSHLDAADEELRQALRRVEMIGLSALSVVRRSMGERTLESIGEIADTRLGKMLDSKRQSGQATKYLRNINVRWGGFDLKDVQETLMTDRDLERYDINDGDVFACEGGEPGRCAVWRGPSGGMSFQKAVHRLRVNDSEIIKPEFLALMLAETIRSGRANKLLTGTTIKHLPQEKLRSIRVPVPDLETQKRVVREFSEVHAFETRMKEIVEQSQRRSAALRRSLLHAAFTGRLTEQSASEMAAVAGV